MGLDKNIASTSALTTEPYLRLLRRLLPVRRVGSVGLDLSSVIGLIVLFIVIQVLALWPHTLWHGRGGAWPACAKPGPPETKQGPAGTPPGPVSRLALFGREGLSEAQHVEYILEAPSVGDRRWHLRPRLPNPYLAEELPRVINGECPHILGVVVAAEVQGGVTELCPWRSDRAIEWSDPGGNTRPS